MDFLVCSFTRPKCDHVRKIRIKLLELNIQFIFSETLRLLSVLVQEVKLKDIFQFRSHE